MRSDCREVSTEVVARFASLCLIDSEIISDSGKPQWSGGTGRPKTPTRSPRNLGLWKPHIGFCRSQKRPVCATDQVDILPELRRECSGK